jgi:hypothetical protein
MRYIIHNITLLLLLLPAVLSCEKLMIENDRENSHVSNFELLWNEMDQKYSFFQFKNIDWDSVYHLTRPLINDSLTDQEFFDILAGMLYSLRDGHVNLYSDFDRSRSFEWYSGHPENFSGMVQARYLGNDFRVTGPFMTQIIDSIGYVYCSSFADEFSERDIDMVIEQFHDLKGVIFDIRNNSGGLSSTGKRIASRFSDHPRLVSFTLYKTGPGHGDFSEPQSNYLLPRGIRQFTGPVAVLSNRRVYSAANDFVLNMQTLPHVAIIGDQTGGGGGTPYDYELNNGWRCRFPRTQTLTIDGFNIEHGILPDIKVNMSRSHERQLIDTIIETAITWIDSQSR